MAFDLGFNFRQTSSFVTDQSFAVAETDLIYPHTYTNGNGDSINAGWSPQADGFNNRSSTNDPRIAGRVNTGGAASETFKVDLTSGSAPGAGTYTVDLAFGSAGNPAGVQFQLKDNATVVLQVTSTTVTVAADHYIDATLTDVAATTTWIGTTISQAFASTQVNLTLNQNLNALFPCAVAHFRLTLQGAGTTVSPPRMLMLLGVGA